jgi:hypothetical protein
MRILTFLAVLVSGLSSLAQITGTLSVSGSGCGCLAGCNLTAFGGPDCGSGVLGNCDAGYQFMSWSITIPADCEVQVSAQMATRPGCSASGADTGGAGDRLKVQGASAKPYQTGTVNATLTDQWTQAGPGTITVSGFSDRADEIINYQVVILSGSCTYSTLPVEFAGLSATPEKDHIAVEWSTASEEMNDFFTVEYSPNEKDWIAGATVPGAGYSGGIRYYSATIPRPVWHSCYVRILQTDFNGHQSVSRTIAISLENENTYWTYQRDRMIIQLFTPPEYAAKGYEARLIDPAGRIVEIVTITPDTTPTFHVQEGVYILSITGPSGELIWITRAGAD